MKLITGKLHMKWAVHPSDVGRITYIDGVWEGHNTLPHENEVITRPFLVDPVSKAEIPVRVVQLVEMYQQDPPVIAVVVAREQ